MMQTKLYIICEGQSEEAFVEKILVPYLGDKTKWRVTIIPIIVETSRDKRAGRIYKGGLSNYAKPKRDILNTMNKDCVVTTMFDFFRLPVDFPGMEDRHKFHDDKQLLDHIEVRMKQDLLSNKPTFREDHLIPYIQFHEFETLFYCDLDSLRSEYISEEEQLALDQLEADVQGMEPETINNGADSAPSKRLLDAFGYHKGDAVITPLNKIGIDRMREACPHFGDWISLLEYILQR